MLLLEDGGVDLVGLMVMDAVGGRHASLALKD